ncbi:MAG: hypothetical protein WC824_09800 [Bacteroidota bacterium]|jgi:hypothetical protein
MTLWEFADSNPFTFFCCVAAIVFGVGWVVQEICSCIKNYFWACYGKPEDPWDKMEDPEDEDDPDDPKEDKSSYEIP